MKAVVITRFGDPSVLQLQEVAAPEPTAHELLVEVHATALNRADVLQRLGRYPPPAGTREDIPGLEFAGEVAEVGKNVTRFKKGDRVMGLLPGEGYAEKVVTPERLALPIPDTLSYDQAAAIPEVFLTAFDALFLQLHLQMGERCLIHAIGSGVGLAALQLARHAGATVFGTAGSDTKLDRASELGLEFGINYKKQDFEKIVRTETGGQGVHAILDTVGAAYWQQNLACLAHKGRMILLGMLGGSKTEANLATILSKRLHIMGTVLRARSLEEKASLTLLFKQRVLPLLAAGKIMPVIDRTFALDDAAQAHTVMQENKNFGKIVLRVRG